MVPAVAPDVAGGAAQPPFSSLEDTTRHSGTPPRSDQGKRDLDHQLRRLRERQRLSRGTWVASICPKAGEASATWVPAGTPTTDSSDDRPTWQDLLQGQEYADEFLRRSIANRNRSARRAKKDVRQYIVANECRYMWVLTFAEALHGPEGFRAAMAAVARFVRTLRRHGIYADAYVFAPEPHPNKDGKSLDGDCEHELCPCNGHGWHVNFSVRRRVPFEVMGEAWGEGFVFVTDWLDPKRRHRGRTTTSKANALRDAAGYQTKYVTKAFDVPLPPGVHRYEVGQGFQPGVERFEDEDQAVVVAHICFVLGHGAAAMEWASSNEWENWEGPPCITARAP